MAAAKQITRTVYECEGCHRHVEVAEPWADDYPEGYYFTVRRETAARKHSITNEMFCCSKDCLLTFVTYGISRNAHQFEPIGRKRRPRCY
ncbi:hypothetical protein J2S90_000083 [Arthrobacter bambusae]|uniref:Uncharacterized protein n=1 Tax=Arthrobacter bambusae TaxID=1338426 RepID=A0AAW8D5I9_9MICC|nr:hypothetical protein [Arthrobacter bambusae]MDQ0128863.1 hypothetical protein [Arthrobacter bambusae]MDQ0180204.1 hypothetical protein [Arthrobacter bambusae]